MPNDLLYHQLKKLGFRNPQYKTPNGHSTFVVMEFAESDESVHFSSTIVDPSMPEKGNAEAYLDLLPMQRVALEIGEIAHIMLDGLSGVALHGPTDDTINEKIGDDRDALVKCLRWLSQKAAIQALQLATDTRGHA